LLPSSEFKALCGRMPVAVVKGNPVAQEFDISCGNSWVVVLDGKGETLDSFLGDLVGQGCTQESAGAFPVDLASRIEDCLRRTESLQELERRWLSQPWGGSKAFIGLEAYAKRAMEMSAIRHLAKRCDEVLTQCPPEEKEMRWLLRVMVYLARLQDNFGCIRQRESRDRLIEEGMELLLEQPAHPKAVEVSKALFEVLQQTFDFPGRTKACAERLRKAGAQDHAEALSQDLSKVLAWLQSSLPEFKGREKARYSAILGDAEAALKLAEDPACKAVLEQFGLLDEAQERLARREPAP
jgi:hypothetical protein